MSAVARDESVAPLHEAGQRREAQQSAQGPGGGIVAQQFAHRRAAVEALPIRREQAQAAQGYLLLHVEHSQHPATLERGAAIAGGAPAAAATARSSRTASR